MLYFKSLQIIFVMLMLVWQWSEINPASKNKQRNA